MSDLVQRVTFALLRPAASMALKADVALKDMKRYIELAYYHEAKRRGLKMREIKDTMNISMSKVGLLSKQLKEHFLESELEHGLKRQILALTSNLPLTEARIAQALPGFESGEVHDALEVLIEEGVMERRSGRTDTFVPTRAAYRMSTDPWMARIGGLHTLLGHVTNAIEARFLRDEDLALVRNLRFRVRPEDLDRLRTFYEEHLFPLVLELDDAVEQEDASIPIQLSYLWSAEMSAEEED